MKNQISKVIITGASGFVGQNLTKFLKERNIEVQSVNLRNLGNIQIIKTLKADAIIHLAGLAHDTKNSINDDDYFKINTLLTQEVFLKFSENLHINDFIFLSSVKAVADSTDIPLTEATIPKPQTPYGASKYAAEKILDQLSVFGEKRVFVLRPCMIHGPHNKGNLNLLYKFVIHRIPYPLKAFDNKRSLLSVENLCEIIFMLLTRKEIKSDTFLIADSQPLSTLDIVNIIEEVTKKKIVKLSIPKSIIRLFGKMGNLFKLPINSHTLNKLTENYTVDNSKILKTLKIEDLPISSSDGLRKTITTFIRK